MSIKKIEKVKPTIFLIPLTVNLILMLHKIAKVPIKQSKKEFKVILQIFKKNLC
jgi:hypothetical protein